jgi:hypothetical protein
MKKPSVEIMNVTPQMAENWLEQNSDRNRKLREAKVAQYVADILAGRWRLSDQAISFDINEALVNGQHRLHAVVRADKPILSLVMKNLPTEAMLVLDGGMKRSTDDNFGMYGCEYPKNCGSTVRRVFLGVRSYAGRAFTDQEVHEFMKQSADAVRFAHRVLPNGKFGSASLRAPVVRAYIKRAARTRLEHFGEVLLTGMMVPGDEAAIHLRNFVMELASSSNGRDRASLYGKTESALAAFLREEPIRRLLPTKDELFPIKAIDGIGEDDGPRLAEVS